MVKIKAMVKFISLFISIFIVFTTFSQNIFTPIDTGASIQQNFKKNKQLSHYVVFLQSS